MLDSNILRDQMTVRRLRLAAGLIMFCYLTLHFIMHALGNVSLEAMQWGTRIHDFVWHSTPGTIALYGAFAIHFTLALYALFFLRFGRLTLTRHRIRTASCAVDHRPASAAQQMSLPNVLAKYRLGIGSSGPEAIDPNGRALPGGQKRLIQMGELQCPSTSAKPASSEAFAPKIVRILVRSSTT
jgi:hypothetical protein